MSRGHGGLLPESRQPRWGRALRAREACALVPVRPHPFDGNVLAHDEGRRRMIPLTVREAAQGSTWGAEVLQLPGLELLRASLERRLPDPPVTKLTGLRLSEVGLGWQVPGCRPAPGGSRRRGSFWPGQLHSSRTWRSPRPCSPARRRGWG